MAFDGSDNCWVPDVPIGMDQEWRLKIAQFGDGYQQRTLEGINALNIKWQVTFENRPKSVIQSMLTYLEQQKARAFIFRDPVSGTIYDVFCDSWQVTWPIRRPGRVFYGTLSAEFVKANGVTV